MTKKEWERLTVFLRDNPLDNHHQHHAWLIVHPSHRIYTMDMTGKPYINKNGFLSHFQDMKQMGEYLFIPGASLYCKGGRHLKSIHRKYIQKLSLWVAKVTNGNWDKAKHF